jgi:hypothetical protein
LEAAITLVHGPVHAVELCHWYNTLLPVAITQKVFDWPEQIVALVGCAVIAIGVFTTRVALLEVVTPQTVLARQRYKFPFSEIVTVDKINVAFVALVILAQDVPLFVLTCHWKFVAVAAVIVKLAFAASQTVWLMGCAVIAGLAPGFITKEIVVVWLFAAVALPCKLIL